MTALDVLSPKTRTWFERAFETPTPAQELGWPAIAGGGHVLIQAPTGSGKTLAAFLLGLDRLNETPGEGLRLLYVSPLKALNYDIERNLRSPLAGLGSKLSVAVRTGDTPADERRRMLRTPPDILITTPESLFLLLTSQARENLRGIETVILDEVHAVAGTKRGAHLALSLERLERLVAAPFQRVALSATQRPMEEIGRFVAGSGREIDLVDAGVRKELDLQVVVPVEDMRELGVSDIPSEHTAAAERTPSGVFAQPESALADSGIAQRSIWPSIYPAILELVRQHRSTIVFVNNRRLAERLALRINELAGEELARAHHGSLAREQRIVVEELLKAGRIPCLVATSSLELGIDMGAVDLVIQVESPKSVARGLQRVGRAGHELHSVSKGRIFPKYRADLLESAVVARAMRDGEIEETRIPRNPLDVLAQQVVAICADEEISVDEVHELVRRAYPFSELSRAQLENVLDMLAGRYPSDEFAELRPRIVWDRTAGTIRGRTGARRLAVTNAGTIPDRGLFGVFLADGGGRVGELDEEMVYEAREGQTFVLGASTWRIEEITRDRVLVSPAPGLPGIAPFWKGEGVGRPAELGEKIGKAARELSALGDDDRDPTDRGRLSASTRSRPGISSRSSATRRPRPASSPRTGRSSSSASATRSATGASASSRRSAAVCTRPGRWRCGRGCASRSAWRCSRSGRTTASPFTSRTPTSRRRSRTSLLEPDEIEDLLLGELAQSALYGARFRENAARALLIPRRRPGQRTPLWQQRLKAQSLLQVARRYPQFPIVLESFRECLQDVFDLPALHAILRGIRTRSLDRRRGRDRVGVAVRVLAPLRLRRDVHVRGRHAARGAACAGALARSRPPSGAHGRGGAPRAPRSRRDRAGRGVASPDAAERRRAARPPAPRRAACSTASTTAGSRRRSFASVARFGSGSASIELSVAVEDAGLVRDALGTAPPGGVPQVFLEPVEQALRVVLRRYARTHGPFTTAEVAVRFALDLTLVEAELGRRWSAPTSSYAASFAREARSASGAITDVLRRIRRATLAVLRREVEPAEQAAFGRFLPAWHGIGRRQSLREALVPLQGVALPATLWESDVLPRRVPGFRPAELDVLCASGEVVWVGAGLDRVAVYFRDDAPLLGPPPAEAPPDGEAAAAIRAALSERALFWGDLVDATTVVPEDVLTSLWELVWAGEVTNDSWTPLRASRRYELPQPDSAGRRFARTRRIIASPTQGRWSLTPRALRLGRHRRDRRALAELLLERQGIVTRDGVRGEGIRGGYGAVYAELKTLETLGVCRRGYFVEGLGGAQFALPGAVERLRELRAAQRDERPEVARPRRRRSGPAVRLGAPVAEAIRCTRRPRRRRLGRPARRGGGALRRAGRTFARTASGSRARVARAGTRRARRPRPRRRRASDSRSSVSTACPSPRARRCSSWSRPASSPARAAPSCVRNGGEGSARRVREVVPVRAPHLYPLLRGFALGSFVVLGRELEEGAELPFAFEEHVERRGPSLYELRPLVRAFIEEREHDPRRARGRATRASRSFAESRQPRSSRVRTPARARVRTRRCSVPSCSAC